MDLSRSYRPTDFRALSTASTFFFSFPPSTLLIASFDDVADPSRPLSDGELQALRNRDPEMVRRHIYGRRDYILSVLKRYSGTPGTAPNLVQETFFQALRSLPNFRGDSALTTWLYSIARNVALSHYRESKRCTSVDQETLTRVAETTDGPFSKSTPATWNPADETVQGEEWTLLYDALDQLSESHREIIELRDLEELSTREAAERLGLTRGNVRVRLHRAHKKLKAILAPQVDPDYWLV